MINAFKNKHSFLWMVVLFVSELGVAFFCTITGSLLLYAFLSVSGLLFACYDRQ